MSTRVLIATWVVLIVAAACNTRMISHLLQLHRLRNTDGSAVLVGVNLTIFMT